MSKYGESIGIWELSMGGTDFILHPKKGDNRRFRDMLVESRKTNDESNFLNKFDVFIKEIISRDYPPENDSEKEELDLFVEFNEDKLLTETMIAFRWTTREAVVNAKNSLKKENILLRTKKKSFGKN